MSAYSTTGPPNLGCHSFSLPTSWIFRHAALDAATELQGRTPTWKKQE